MKTAEEILNEIYSAYGTDSGMLFGITDKSIVKAIIEFTLTRLSQAATERVAMIEQAAINLNNVIDAFWNSELVFRKVPESHIKAISEAQKTLKKWLAIDATTQTQQIQDKL